MRIFIKSSLFVLLLFVFFHGSAEADTEEAKAALIKVEKQLAGDPDNPEILKSHAEIATWNGDYPKASASYKKLRNLKPDDPEIIVALARVESWQGHLDEAAGLYEEYLGYEPEDHKAILDYAYTQSWRGDFVRALSLLGDYRNAGGDETEYKKARARFMAGASYSDEALFLADEVLAGQPDNYHARFSRILALKQSGRMQAALDGLEAIRDIPGDEASKRELEKVVKTPLRSNIRADFSYSSDSDDIDIAASTLEGQYTVYPGLYLLAGVQGSVFEAERLSGLDTIRNNDKVVSTAGWVGARYALGDRIWLSGRAGRTDTNVTDHTGLLAAMLEYRPSDELNLKIGADRNFHAVSPRALSLDITRTQETASATWRPDMTYTIEMRGIHAGFSDGNELWEAGFAPRASVVRNEDYNLDLGVSARWFTFDDELGNGYYDPAGYQQYLLTSFSYIKLSGDSGLSIVVAPGVHKDESMDSFKFSGNFAAEGTFGLYDDWMLKVRAGYVDNIGVSSKSYRRMEGGLSITRRF
jgi:tetratricopeptide (TPR) repeat protein